MKIPGLVLCALFGSCIGVAACSRTTDLSNFRYAPSVAAGRHHDANPLGYSVLYSFGGFASDAIVPAAGLTSVNGTFYGTTEYGGSHNAYCLSNRTACGTVFSITTGGVEKVLHSFRGAPDDGGFPEASLIDVGGTLYGTTFGGGKYGGAPGAGTVFSITTAGTEKVLYSFRGSGDDGFWPEGRLIDVGGTLYGTTYFGGRYGGGTIFSITTGGTEKVLYEFRGPPTDGNGPAAGLVNLGGTLYGTTSIGGKYCLTKYEGCGTVFSVTTGGTEKVLHYFRGAPDDGGIPDGDLINLGGTLYGTTSQGGKYCAVYGGCGTIFSITTRGAENVEYTFRGTPDDGRQPLAGLINTGATVYGTTANGGEADEGTVFFLDLPTSHEGLLRSFGHGTKGAANPAAALIHGQGTLYGTTEFGGQYGGGTVFTQTP